MKQKPRGACIIITNKDYSETRRDRRPGTRRRRSSKQKPGVNLEDMVGTEKDITSLRKLFEWLHFEVATFENLKSAEMLNLLRSYSRMDHTPYDCFVCCISSHGCPKGIYGTDGKQLDVDRLTDLFRGESCQSLINKPKLFFIDACRGNLRDSGYKPDRQSSGRASVTKEGTSKRTQRESVSPHESDFFIGYSTPPGYVAWQNPDKGSWFIRKLCEIFKTYAGREHLLELVTRVNDEVSKLTTDHGNRQIPYSSMTLRKQLYFSPRKERPE